MSRAIEYNNSTNILTVWHQGKHTYTLKCQSESKEAKKDLLKTVLKIFPRLSNAKLINVGSQYYIQWGYLEVAKELVEACTDKDIVSESTRESYNELLGFDQHSEHAVSIVKSKMDTVDLFYIYKINDHKWNGSGTYVFKSSQTAVEIGLLMDKSARNTQFKDVVAHMDGLHSWAKGLINLTLWVTKAASLITHHLACMDCESENMENIALFLKLFDEILRKVKKDPTFIWSPQGIMVDENGANKNAIRQGLGDEMAKDAVTKNEYFNILTKLK